MRPRLRRLALVTGALCILRMNPAASASPRVTAMPVVSGLEEPVYLTAPPGDSTRLFVLEQESGKIKIVREGALLPTPFLTLRDLDGGGEKGLFSMAFHPNYAANDYFYVSYSRAGGSAVRRYRVSADPDRADTTSGIDIIYFPSTAPIHFGGWIGFGPDGYLYLARGDGSYSWHAQRDGIRSGKILRLDVDGAFPYDIPPTNPYADSPSPKNEFWSRGLRNPWRCSFDRATGDLYIADVGYTRWEEVNFQPASSPGGENYGWDKLEGEEIFYCPDPCDTSGLVKPLALFEHSEEKLFCAIVGGYVYRGAGIPGLEGSYFLADFCADSGYDVWTLRMVDGVATEITDRTDEIEGSGVQLRYISSFGEDALGELYLCDLSAGIVYKIVADSTGIAASRSASARALSLQTRGPNPGHGVVELTAGWPRAQRASIRIFDSAGRLVRTLGTGTLGDGAWSGGWDSRDDTGAGVTPGIYFVRLSSGKESAVRKITVLR